MADSSSQKPPVVCVFCGSSPGQNPAHLESASTLATSLSENQYKLVYGGGTMGLMGELARTFVSLSGPKSAHGIIPRALIRTEKDGTLRNAESHSPSPSREPKAKVERSMSSEQLQRYDTNKDTDPDQKIVPFSEFGATTIVPDMHTRKRMMAQEVESGGPGSGFIALAGGYGTIEEVMEMVTWNQLGIHQMPIVLVNIDGYWNGVLEWVKNSIRAGFIGENNADILSVVTQPEDVVQALRDYKIAEGRFKLDWTAS